MQVKHFIAKYDRQKINDTQKAHTPVCALNTLFVHIGWLMSYSCNGAECNGLSLKVIF